MEKMKVGSLTDVASLAGAITGSIKNDGSAELKAIGAGAVNQMVKALITARGYLAPEGICIEMMPSFCNVEIHEEEKTAIRFEVRKVGR